MLGYITVYVILYEQHSCLFTPLVHAFLCYRKHLTESQNSKVFFRYKEKSIFRFRQLESSNPCDHFTTVNNSTAISVNHSVDIISCLSFMPLLSAIIRPCALLVCIVYGLQQRVVNQPYVSKSCFCQCLFFNDSCQYKWAKMYLENTKVLSL